jgi:hypothetical protein
MELARPRTDRQLSDIGARRRDGAVSGRACRASTPRPSSRAPRRGRGGRFTVGPASGSLGVQRYLPTPTSSRRASTRPTGRSACSTSSRASCSTSAASDPRSSCASSSPVGHAAHPRAALRSRPRLVPGAAAAGARLPPRLLPRLRRRGPPHDGRAPLVPLGDSFALTERRHFVFSWGAAGRGALAPLCERFLRETVRYWHLWVKHCDVPPLYQER